jgi:UDP:flavonoid glycosyltransferase YjiC (YdhE family)
MTKMFIDGINAHFPSFILLLAVGTFPMGPGFTLLDGSTKYIRRWPVGFTFQYSFFNQQRICMKIVLMTCGSRGDVQPMIALTLAIQAAGHDALLAGPPEKATWAGRLGCPYVPLGIDMTAFIDTLDGVQAPGDVLRFNRQVRREVDAQFKTIPDIIGGADLVVGSSLIFALSSIAEHRKIAYRYIVFSPQLLPSVHHPHPIFRRQGMPAWWNRAGWYLAGFLDRFNFGALVNVHRRQLGLAPVKDLLRHLLGPSVIVASDHAIAPVAPDVTQPTVQTGYLHLTQPQKTLPALDQFLADGPPPVYCGFGSMPRKDQIRLVPDIVKALRRAGQRMVLARFWDEPIPVEAGNDLLYIQKYPHLDLFPRMAAVIHHGGAGTTATAAISGVPQIIVPYALDQFHWGYRIWTAGMGPKPIPRARLNARRLTAAVNRCLNDDPRYQQRAGRIASIIRRQDSLSAAVAALVGDGRTGTHRR